MSEPERKRLARRALACLDLTNLDDDSTEADIEALCRRAVTPHGSVAAICIWPRHVAQAKKLLRRRKVRIATVVNFPSGGEDTEAVVAEARQAVERGADEIDLVMAWRRVADAPKLVEAQIVAVCDAIGDALLKVILETGELRDERLVRRAAEIAIRAGADFIKTSTGKAKVNATPEAARIMLSVIADYGGEIGLKPAGGIRTLDDAGRYFALADEMLGPGWATPATFRIGASGLLDAILAEIEGKSSPAGAGH